MTAHPGVILALDWGEARIGVAACDREGLLAFPVATVRAGAGAVPELLGWARDYEAATVVIGLPRSMSGGHGPAAQRILGYARDFARLAAVPVYVVDERLTTVAAARQLRWAGRNTREQRSIIDQQAAVGILESALESFRNRGVLPGRVLSTPTTSTAGETSAPEPEGDA